MNNAQKYATVGEYIDLFPKEIQDKLEELRRVIREEAPHAEETISYQVPTFKLKRNLVHFAAFKDHVSLFPGPSAVSRFAKDLFSYKTSKGTVQFPLDKPIPLDLIRKIVKFRVEENLKK